MANDDLKIRIPIERLKELSRALDLSMVILLAHHPASGEDHIVTYGKTLEDCSQAAEFGNALKHAMGWPESLHMQPSRVKRLQARVKELEKELNAIKSMSNKPTCESIENCGAYAYCVGCPAQTNPQKI